MDLLNRKDISVFDRTWEDHDKLQDWDLVQAFEYHDTPFPLSDVKQVLAKHEGCRDVENWAWLVERESGGFVFIEGGCDYTGWDCHSSLDVHGTSNSLEKVLSSTGKYQEEFTTQVQYGRELGFRDIGID